MMGHGYYGNTRDQSEFVRKFAWLPVRSASHKLIFLRHYYVKQIYYDNNGRPPIKGLYWSRIYTEQEYFILKLTGNE
jgi:hypothetical protein